MARSAGFILWVAVISVMGLLGCASEYNTVTEQEEWLMYDNAREVKLGEAIAKEVEKEEKLYDDATAQDKVETLGQRIVEVCDRKDIIYHFKIVEDEDVNAFSLPGGFVYVHSSLVKAVKSDAELAAVLAHEVAHIVAKHAVKKLQAYQGYSLLRLALIPAGGQDVGPAFDLAFAQILMGYSRQDELLADRLAAKYLEAAGFEPQAMVGFLLRLKDINRCKLRPISYLRSHPYYGERIAAVRKEIGKEFSFDDYLNLGTE